MGEEKRPIDLPEKGEGLEIQFGEHTVGWYRHAAWFAQQMFDSRTLPEHIKSAQQAFAILCKGDELGLKPWASWTFIYPTKQGRLALMTKGALAVVQSKPTFGAYAERMEQEGKPEMRAVAVATRRGHDPVIKEFSLQDAETAGLLKQRFTREGQKYDSTYQSFLKDMLLSRARGRALDIAFAAELGGIAIEGVAEDSDMMVEREKGTPNEERVKVAPPRRDPLLAAVGQKQLEAGKPTQLEQELTRAAVPELNAKVQPGVPVMVDPKLPPTTLLMVNQQGQEVARIENLAPPQDDVLDPAAVKVISDQVDEVFGPPAGAPAPKEPVQERAVPPKARPAATPPVAAGVPTGTGAPAGGTKVGNLMGEVLGHPPIGQIAKALGRPSICQRCNTKLNELGGCDVCGWPGADMRSEDER